MQVTVALETRYFVAPDGSVWSQVGMARSFWERYLEVFDSVRIVARGARVDSVAEGWSRVDHDRIIFHGVRNYQGPWQYLQAFKEVHRNIRAAVPHDGAVILRVPSHLGNGLERELERIGYPYAAEVVGDPHEVFAPGVVRHPLRPVFRRWFSRQLRRQCNRACGVAYVTKRTLQERYPPGGGMTDPRDGGADDRSCQNAGRFITDYSSIELPGPWFAPPEGHPHSNGPHTVITVGSLEQGYKGTDVLIDAIAQCVREGSDVRAVIVGDGKCRPSLMSRAARHSIADRIRFAGQVSAGREIQKLLDAAHLFVLPSRTEGLPRALIEAMARGLPCVASAVGGIPELLPPEDMVGPADAKALATKLREVLANPGRMSEMTRRNRLTALQYRDTVLRERRFKFYKQVREYTRQWEQQRRRVSCGR